MTQWGYEEGNNGGQEPTQDNAPKALRDAYDALKKQNEELLAGLQTVQRDLKTQKVQSIFDSAGVPGAAALYQGDADPEKAKEWIEAIQSAFNPAGATSPTDNASAPVVDAAQAEQLSRMNEAGAQGHALGSMEAAQAGVHDATDLQALIANFANAARNAGG